MSADEISPTTERPETMQQDVPPATATGPKKRPRLDLSDPRERKRGKSIFGLVLGTLNKAKVEDRERNASEAAKKRQLIDQRLQAKLRKETDSSRRAEEVKKDKTTANRREEELQLKDSIHKLRRTRLPLLSNFLITSDNIPTNSDGDSPPPSKDPLVSAPRSHPPPLYYLPARLTPAQDTFLSRRKAEVQEAAEKEWVQFKAERSAGVEEITQLRQRVLEEQERKKAERETREAEATKTAPAKEEMDVDDDRPAEAPKEEVKVDAKEDEKEAEMEAKEEVAKDEVMQADDDDAVEY